MQGFAYSLRIMLFDLSENRFPLFGSHRGALQKQGIKNFFPEFIFSYVSSLRSPLRGAQQKLRGEVSPSAGCNKQKMQKLFPGISLEISGIAMISLT